jgi:hypothetical protein
MLRVMDEIYTQVCPKQIEDEVALRNPNNPLIYGDFTNWQPVPMVEITRFAEQYQS